MKIFWRIIRSLFFMIEPERSHKLTIFLLKFGIFNIKKIEDDTIKVNICNINFSNPLGMAAGFDKNAKIPYKIIKMGFGFTEIGTVTPFPQVGNKKPRIFRIIKDQALINNVGFCNNGYEEIYKQFLSYKKTNSIIGINIGINKGSKDWILDYVKGIILFYKIFHYVVINVSSPNTIGLRNLQKKENLLILLKTLINTREKEYKKYKKSFPIFLKIAPDLTEVDLDEIAEVVLYTNIDGLIISNTTIQNNNYNNISGGLSGKPLFNLSTTILAKMRIRIGPNIPIIGVGGIYNKDTAIEKIMAGADLIQIYTSFVYYGPKIIQEILKGLILICKRDGVNNILEYRDYNTIKWSKKPIKIK